MYSSQKEIDILFEIYKDSRTVFRINDIALLTNSAITNICYLNREICVNGQSIQYRQMKREILLNTR